MHLNFQTEADIKREIVEALVLHLKRAATIVEIAESIWSRSAIDGTKSGVYDTVVSASVKMLNKKELIIDRVELVADPSCCRVGDNGERERKDTFLWPDVLTRMSFIRN